MTQHRCDLKGCDGTRLGHELANDFPAQTARIDEAFRRMAEPPDGLRVNPANLQVDPPGLADAQAGIKPPLGLMPKWLHDEHRMAEIDAAIDRYHEAGYEVPEEWTDERVEIARRLTARRHQKHSS